MKKWIMRICIGEVIYMRQLMIFLKKNLVDISEFSIELEVSRQSSITPVFGEKFDFIKKLILNCNAL